MDQIDFARIPLHARRSFVSRPETTPHLLELLASDPDPDVRLAVAGHPSTPLRSLQRLAGDAVARVASRAGVRAVAVKLAGEGAEPA